ncbi:MAG TPA: glutathione peroxidase [Terracidiphilus sp.]|nr:glutathione peroxidase [Terracidiphilus sp.]
MTASIYDIPVQKITGEPTSLAEFRGKVLLVVNVASKCGLTPQYEALEKVYEKYRDKGLVIAGFPANDFKSQEPGTEAEIQSFCTANYGVQFPMFTKITVTGANKHPLYRALIAAQPSAVSASDAPFRETLKGYGIETLPEPELLWNFEKFLVSRKGEVVRRFSPDTVPDHPAVIAAIESELAK